jgi:hypothetical protein
VWSRRKFLRCQRGVPARVVDIVVRNTTALSTTQYYSAFISDSYVHFGRSVYRLRL